MVPQQPLRKRCYGQQLTGAVWGTGVVHLHRRLQLGATMMITPATLQERQRIEVGAHQDHLVRLHSVQTDLALNLPHSITLPDGEEGPRCHTKLLRLQDSEQHAEITRTFIRPPPNRIVPDSNTLPPLRSNSVGILQKPTPPLALTDPALLVARSHSVNFSKGHMGKLSFPRETPLFNPSVSSNLWLPSVAMNSVSRTSVARNSCLSGVNGGSNRTCGCSPAALSDPPPPYSDAAKEQWGGVNSEGQRIAVFED